MRKYKKVFYLAIMTLMGGEGESMSQSVQQSLVSDPEVSATCQMLYGYWVQFLASWAGYTKADVV